MNPPALVLQNVGKSYLKHRSELHRFARWFGFSVTPLAEQWAVRNVSFRVNRGESVGIIGQNGAASDVLYTLGSSMKGVLWEVLAVPEIRVQAERLARLLLKGDHPRRDASSTHAR